VTGFVSPWGAKVSAPSDMVCISTLPSASASSALRISARVRKPGTIWARSRAAPWAPCVLPVKSAAAKAVSVGAKIVNVLVGSFSSSS